MNGFLLIDKPSGWTSRDVCNKIQHRFHVKRVGHTGTLDPFATGLMIVALGNATKATQFVEDEDKEYIAELKLGIKTSTGDLNGDILENIEVRQYSYDEIKFILDSFLGKQKQIPPMTSAVHYNGRKLYTYAHQGIEIDRPSKDIEIFSIELIEYKNDVIKFKTHVSKGTYIRVLGEDIAKQLGTVGHLISLRRIKVGNNKIEDAKTLDTYTDNDIIPIANILEKSLFTWEVDGELAIKTKNGVHLIFEDKPETIFFKGTQNNAIAVYKKIGDIYKCQRGLW